MAKKKIEDYQLEHPLFRGKAFDKLKEPEQLDQLLTITSTRSWLLLVALGGLFVLALLWSILGIVSTNLSGSGMLITQNDNADLEAVIYVSPADSQQIREGMSVKISPLAVRPEEFGYMEGVVASVDRAISTQADMVATLGNDALVQSLIASGALNEVRVELTQDSSTPTGFAWTTAAGPPVELQPFQLADGNIVINEQRPLELVLPIALR